MSGGDLPEAKMNEAQCTPMVVVRADEGPAVNAMECRAKRGTNDSALYLEKTSIRGAQRGNADLARLAVSR